jgi:peptidylprolyl isomerase
MVIYFNAFQVSFFIFLLGKNMRLLFSIVVILFSFQTQATLPDGLYATLQTNRGDIVLKLAFKEAPLTVINFVGLAQGEKKSNQPLGVKFYDGLKFHRVIKNFMIQGGDPKGNGTGGPGYQFRDEFSELKHHTSGILSMANSGKNTNGSQFFITHESTPWLDGKHTVFGAVVKGMDVVNSIKKNDIIQKVKITRLGKQAQNFKTDESAFQAQLAKYENQAFKKNAKKQQKFEQFVQDSYQQNVDKKLGYFFKTQVEGKGKSPQKGDLVNIKLEIKSETGVVLIQANKALSLSAGTGRLIEILDNAILTMKAGEKRVLVAPYYKIYGNVQRAGLRLDAVLVFTLELLSINEN